MPIFEYECRKCGCQFEYFLLPSSSAASCPSCHGKQLKQLISLCAVSSETTRSLNRSAAQKRAAAIKKDKQHEENKYIREHMPEHLHYHTPVGGRPGKKK